MRMWLDTEFNEFNGQTISLGIVADDGREFYEVLELTEQPTKWVEENVLPVLHREPLLRAEFQERLIEWLGSFGSLQIYVDHIADAYRFLRLLESDDQGGWYAVPSVVIGVVTGLPGSQKDYSLIEHNALSDARALRGRYKTEKIHQPFKETNYG